ncbi:MAG: 5'-methylthioadenosine/adenosylhomocysteine nucleosidase [Muribaculaceae bacterium]|nr:5'-methylthioadenosine/adenosylhomocysteine nucleosidase [Muribaculaceae bacterium]
MKILIMAAMDKEMALLKDLLEEGHELTIDGYPVASGRISGHEVVVAKCGIGKVNAALNTYRLIRGFAPELVINSGVAGGTGRLGIGELLVATGAGCYDVWCGPGTERGEADGYPKVMAASERVVDIARSQLGDEGVGYGVIATGDVFVSSAEEVAMIRSVFPDALAVDMESAAIAQTCALTGVPYSILRVVSDTPGEGENVSQYVNFWTEAPAKTFNAVKRIIAAL